MGEKRTVLSDTRAVAGVDPAALLEEIAQLDCRVAVVEARAEKVIQQAREKCELATAADRAARARLGQQLEAWINAHRAEFARQRTRVCPAGEFGLRTASNVEVADDEAVIAWALECGYDDLVKITRKLVKPALTKRLKQGEAVPGAALVTGERTWYEVAKALVENAKLAAEAAA